MQCDYHGQRDTFGNIPPGVAFGIADASGYGRYLKIEFSNGDVAAVSLGPHPAQGSAPPMPTLISFDTDDIVIVEHTLTIRPGNSEVANPDPIQFRHDSGVLFIGAEGLAISARSGLGRRLLIDVASGKISPNSPSLAGCFSEYVLSYKDSQGKEVVVFAHSLSGSSQRTAA